MKAQTAFAAALGMIALIASVPPAKAEWIGGPKDAHLKNAAWSETGTASWYGGRNGGKRLSKRCANGQVFDAAALTAAHPTLPFGTRVRVAIDGTAREIVVTITDRMPSARRVIDLSVGAARALGILHQGTANVTLTQL